MVNFTHKPIFLQVPTDVDLTLAGDKHGGQLSFPLIGFPIVLPLFRRRYAAGIIEVRGRQLFERLGLGTSILLVRSLVLPEILILDIR